MDGQRHRHCRTVSNELSNPQRPVSRTRNRLPRLGTRKWLQPSNARRRPLLPTNTSIRVSRLLTTITKERPMSKPLFTWDEITKTQKDQDEIVQVDVIPQYIFTYNKTLDACDLWVTNGVADFAESLYQHVNLMPLEGMLWDEYKYSDLIQYARHLYVSHLQNKLPEELLFQV